jgi:hypothetical protein
VSGQRLILILFAGVALVAIIAIISALLLDTPRLREDLVEPTPAMRLATNHDWHS